MVDMLSNQTKPIILTYMLLYQYCTSFIYRYSKLHLIYMCIYMLFCIFILKCDTLTALFTKFLWALKMLKTS